MTPNAAQDRADAIKARRAAEGTLHATGAIVPERQRCICPDICLDHCRACNHAMRDLEETCIADPDWEPDDEYLAIREARMRSAS